MVAFQSNLKSYEWDTSNFLNLRETSIHVAL